MMNLLENDKTLRYYHYRRSETKREILPGEKWGFELGMVLKGDLNSELYTYFPAYFI